MTREMHTLVVDRFGARGHERWREAQSRRRRRKILGALAIFLAVGLSLTLAGIWILLP